MTAADHQPAPAGPAHGHGHERFAGVFGLVVGAVMLVGRRAIARLVADLAGLEPGDRVVDVGCGPGLAAREAARRGASVTGVDPARLMLRLAGYLSGGRHRGAISYLPGTAEKLPVPDRAATVAWSISSVHHWSDLAAGLREVHRVLEPGGRVVLAERLTRPGARGLAAHGATDAEAAGMMAGARSAGFDDVRQDVRKAGRRTLVIVRGVRPD